MVTPSGKRLHNYIERSTILMGKSTISMAIFNSYVKLPEGNLDEINSVSRKALKGVNSYQVA